MKVVHVWNDMRVRVFHFWLNYAFKFNTLLQQMRCAWSRKQTK